MSSNRFRTIKPKLQDPLVRKDLTPKSSKYSPKISPVYSSIRNGGVTMKQDSTNKIKLTRPSTSKNANQGTGSSQFFHSKDNNDKKKYYNSNKRIQITKNSKEVYQYQARSKSKSPIRQPDQIIRQEVYVFPKAVQFDHRQIRIVKNSHPPLPQILLPISNFQSAKHSVKANGIVKAYSASTNQGPVRQYNQDRVAIILNIQKPQNYQKKVAYFGVFDGHGGMHCADYLRDNLHNFVSKQKSFPHSMIQSLTNGFDKCEKVYLQQSYNGKVDHSGSCAIVTFFDGNDCYIANVGDSRAIMSSKQGEVIKQLSVDHKASDEYEQKRIIDHGGKIYQTKLRNSNANIKIFYQGQQHPFIMGPHRVFPGRLSVTRTFGDIQAKLPQFGGNPNGIVCTPQIRKLTITEQDDFILLASDGIYDKMNNEQVVDVVWSTLQRDKGKFKNIHQFCGKAVQNIMKLAFNKKTLDNITVVMIALQGLNNFFLKLQSKQAKYSTNNNQNNYEGNKKVQPPSKNQGPQFQRKYIGRSTSPSNYSSLRTRSFYRN